MLLQMALFHSFKWLGGRPDEALGGGNQGPSAPGWARQQHSQRDPPFVPSKRLPDWAGTSQPPVVSGQAPPPWLQALPGGGQVGCTAPLLTPPAGP